MNEAIPAQRSGASNLRDDFRRGRKAYDLMTAIPLVVLYAFAALGQFGQIRARLAEFHLSRPDIGLSITILSQLAIFLFALIIIGLLFARTPPKGSANGVMPRLMAILGTYLMVGLLLLPHRDLSRFALAASTAMILGGMAWAIYALLYLGRSVSVMAEARHLVTAGPYSWVRHPLYLGEEIAAVGAVIQFFSPWALLLLGLQVGCQLYRMRCEEKVLAENFTEYAGYRAHTFRIIPWVY